MQVILGGGGAIGTELARALTGYTKQIKIVGRSPKKVNPDDILFAGDLLHHADVNNAVKGSEVAYLTAGLPCNTKTWQQDWPVLMQNVIDACVEHHTRLVFFDNIYMYDGSKLDPITEEHPIRPSSKKGKVRANIGSMIWDAVEKRGLTALIARSADFYGPGIKNTSVLVETVFIPLSKKSTANWLVNDSFKHAFTFTPDAAKATALLGNTAAVFGEVWHLPTAKNPYTGKEWVERIAKELGVKPKYRVVGKTMVKLMGIFTPIMREFVEMLYQYDRDYVFNSDKFETRFTFSPTSYTEGIRRVVQPDYVPDKDGL